MLTIHKILCPTDFSEHALAGLKYAVDLAGQFGARICLVHVVPVIPPLPPDPNFAFEVPEYARLLTADAEQKLSELASQHVPNKLEPKMVVGHGDAGAEIVRVAEDERADLIVIATQGLTGLRHFVFGSVAEKVVRLAKCPVLSFRVGTA
ncbi:MAG TPA: universal stress protein [Blastocatellia bacterium]|nr:universal stress protein [Blastocatellia bacterium]